MAVPRAHNEGSEQCRRGWNESSFLFVPNLFSLHSSLVVLWSNNAISSLITGTRNTLGRRRRMDSWLVFIRIMTIKRRIENHFDFGVYFFWKNIIFEKSHFFRFSVILSLIKPLCREWFTFSSRSSNYYTKGKCLDSRVFYWEDFFKVTVLWKPW